MSGSEESVKEVLNNVVVVFKYGDESMMNGIIMVGETEFHVNKQFLSTRSSYFRILFNSDFKEKTQEKVKIEADEIAFKRMMDLLHSSTIEGDISFIKCEASVSYSATITPETIEWCRKFWDESLALLQLLDRFDCAKSCRPIFENFLFFNTCTANNTVCLKCANRMILSLQYNFPGFMNRVTFDPGNITACLKTSYQFIPNLDIQGKNIPFLLKLLGK